MADLTETLDETSVRRVSRLDGRIPVVTGSDSGIGRAIAEIFALESADVVVTFHRDGEGAKATAAQIASAGRRSIVRRLDQRDETSVS